MNEQIRELFQKAEGRYFNQVEQADLESYAEGILARLDTLRAIELAESAVLAAAVKTVMSSYPSMPAEHGADVDQKVRRDLTLVLRYAGFSMLLHDKNFIYDKLAVWLRTIMVALCKVDQVLLGYRALVDACRTSLAADEAEAVIPYLNVLIKELETHGGQPS